MVCEETCDRPLASPATTSWEYVVGCVRSGSLARSAPRGVTHGVTSARPRPGTSRHVCLPRVRCIPGALWVHLLRSLNLERQHL